MKDFSNAFLIHGGGWKKIEEKKIIYDHGVEQRKNKWNSETTLRKIELSEMPDYLSKNYNKYANWLEI